MKQILLAIKPEYVDKIMSGEKRFEFRRKACAQPISSIIIYETAPIKRIVGEVAVIKVLKEPPQLLWPVVMNYAGINKSSFDQYFQGAKIAVAYELGKITRYEQPKNLTDLGFSVAPQSYFYVK